MAVIRSFTPLDMTETEFSVGEITEASDDRIVLSDGTDSDVFGGSFGYDDDGVVSGRLDSASFYRMGQLTTRVSDVDRDAFDYLSLFGSGDAVGIDRFVLWGADTVTGSSGSDYLIAYGGDDLVRAGAGSDIVLGWSGNDSLEGWSGNDRLDGGYGADLLSGGFGNDTYVVDNIRDRIVELADQGTDTVLSSVDHALSEATERLVLLGDADTDGTGNNTDNIIWGNSGDNRLAGKGGDDILYGGLGDDDLRGGADDDVLFGHGNDDSLYGDTGDDALHGGYGNDALTGGGDDDLLSGDSGNDVLEGNAGDDVLSGDQGRDVLLGGRGVDSLLGGGDADTFRFLSVEDTWDGATRDRIADFTLGDKIDLSEIDADETTAGNQAFAFIDAGWFSGDAGELRFKNQFLYGDTDGDGAVDLSLRVQNVASLEATDFIL